MIWDTLHEAVNSFKGRKGVNSKNFILDTLEVRSIFISLCTLVQYSISGLQGSQSSFTINWQCFVEYLNSGREERRCKRAKADGKQTVRGKKGNGHEESITQSRYKGDLLPRTHQCWTVMAEIWTFLDLIAEQIVDHCFYASYLITLW